MTITNLACDLGDGAKLSATFPVDGVLTDPTAVSLEVKNPAGTIVIYTYAAAQITRTAVGSYTKTLDPTLLTTVGKWYYSWIGTGPAAGAEQGTIVVTARKSAA